MSGPSPMREAPTRPGCRCEYCRGRRERTIPPHLKPATWEPGMEPVTKSEYWARALLARAEYGDVRLSQDEARLLARLLVEATP